MSTGVKISIVLSTLAVAGVVTYFVINKRKQSGVSGASQSVQAGQGKSAAAQGRAGAQKVA